MSTRARKITELPANTSLANTDIVIVEKVSNSTVSTTSKMTVPNFRAAFFQGPYANDSAANTGGVLVGEPYYTSDGSVKIRIA